MILATLTGVALTRLYDHSPRAHRVVNWFWTRH